LTETPPRGLRGITEETTMNATDVGIERDRAAARSLARDGGWISLDGCDVLVTRQGVPVEVRSSTKDDDGPVLVTSMERARIVGIVAGVTGWRVTLGAQLGEIVEINAVEPCPTPYKMRRGSR
jgi:hypothetical protein